MLTLNTHRHAKDEHPLALLNNNEEKVQRQKKGGKHVLRRHHIQWIPTLASLVTKGDERARDAGSPPQDSRGERTACTMESTRRSSMDLRIRGMSGAQDGRSVHNTPRWHKSRGDKPRLHTGLGTVDSS